MTADYVSFDVCPDCRGVGLTVNPEAPIYRDRACATCRGVGVINKDRQPLRRADFWLALTIMAAALPLSVVRDVLRFGPRYAWAMARVRWNAVHAASWGARPWGDMPEVGAEWFKQARLRRPDEPMPDEFPRD